jgi:hypothetical protein
MAVIFNSLLTDSAGPLPARLLFDFCAAALPGNVQSMGMSAISHLSSLKNAAICRSSPVATRADCGRAPPMRPEVLMSAPV